MVYRLPVADPAATHMVMFRQAMTQAEAIRDNRGYNHIAGFHGAPGQYCWHHQQSQRTPVQARLFLPWHRAYLWWLEQALQDLTAGVALPYWDWATDAEIPPAYTRARVDNQANPLSATRMYVPTAQPGLNRRTRRAPGRTPGARLPTATEPDDLLTDTDLASFSDRLGAIPDHVPASVGAALTDTPSPAFDPLFF